MSFGFKIWDSNGIQRLSSDNYCSNTLDIFEVSPSSSGSKVYTNMSPYFIVVSQSSIEPTTIDIASLLSFNAMNISVTNSGNDKVVSWSPRYSSGTAYNVNLYVLVM